MKSCVLVVEHDVFIRLDVIDILEDAGFDVLEAGNADEAIRVLESRSAIDAVLTDIEMPGSMDGIRLAHVVRDRWPPVHLVVASGHDSSEPASRPRSLPKQAFPTARDREGASCVGANTERAERSQIVTIRPDEFLA